MASALEYHIFVRRSIPASVAVALLVMLPVVLVPSSHAQINGVPASVTSQGFGGRTTNGTPASVTSLGPRGFAPRSGATFTSSGPRDGRVDGHHRHHRTLQGLPYGYPYAVPVPYPSDQSATDDRDADADADPNYQGGPTIFDRRGSGADSYVPPVRDVPAAHSSQRADSDPPPPEPPQDPTTLIFKDGHTMEVENYAIVGATLFDLTSGHPRKVALADLDLAATQKQNDERGVNFQLPPSPQAN